MDSPNYVHILCKLNKMDSPKHTLCNLNIMNNYSPNHALCNLNIMEKPNHTLCNLNIMDNASGADIGIFQGTSKPVNTGKNEPRIQEMPFP